MAAGEKGVDRTICGGASSFPTFTLTASQGYDGMAETTCFIVVSAEETSVCVYGAADGIAKIKIYQILGSAVDLRTGGGSVGAFKIYRIGNVGRKITKIQIGYV